jgi:acetyl esterase/lipase
MLAAWGAGAETPPVRVGAVVGFYGPFDLAEGYAILPRPDPLDVRAVLRAFLGGAPDAMPARYRDASPSSRVRGGLPPSLLVYAGRDHMVLPRFGREAAAALRAAGSPVVYLELPWAEHGFDLAPLGADGAAALFVAERFLARVL